MAAVARSAILFLSLAACFDSKRIVFRGEESLPDAGAGGGSALPSRATAAAEAAGSQGEAPDQGSADGARSAAPGSLEATAVGGEGSPSDAGGATGAVDAGATDAAL